MCPTKLTIILRFVKYELGGSSRSSKQKDRSNIRIEVKIKVCHLDKEIWVTNTPCYGSSTLTCANQLPLIKKGKNKRHDSPNIKPYIVEGISGSCFEL